MTDLIERAKAAVFAQEEYNDELLAMAYALDFARALIAANELAEASQRLNDLSKNTPPFGGEIMQDRIERTNDNFRQALAAFRAATKGSAND